MAHGDDRALEPVAVVENPGHKTDLVVFQSKIVELDQDPEAASESEANVHRLQGPVQPDLVLVHVAGAPQAPVQVETGHAAVVPCQLVFEEQNTVHFSTGRAAEMHQPLVEAVGDQHGSALDQAAGYQVTRMQTEEQDVVSHLLAEEASVQNYFVVETVEQSDPEHQVAEVQAVYLLAADCHLTLTTVVERLLASYNCLSAVMMWALTLVAAEHHDPMAGYVKLPVDVPQ